MDNKEKHKIALSFPSKFEEAALGIEISPAELEIFKNGLFSKSMDDKWHVFVLENILYLARSWTNFCIYKVFLIPKGERIVLSNFQVNRENKQYSGTDIEYDTILLKKLLQTFLDRTDFYTDPKLVLPLIRSIIDNFDPNNECRRSIGSNNVGLTKQIHESLSTKEQRTYVEILGWDQLRNKILSKPDEEPLVSLFLHNSKSGKAITFYFDKDASELLGQIVIKRISNGV